MYFNFTNCNKPQEVLYEGNQFGMPIDGMRASNVIYLFFNVVIEVKEVVT